MRNAIIELLNKADERKLKLIYSFANSLTGGESESIRTGEGLVQVHNNELMENIHKIQTTLKSMSILLGMGEDVDTLALTDMALDYADASERLLQKWEGVEI